MIIILFDYSPFTEMIFRAQMGLFNENGEQREQEAPSTQELDTELPPAGNDENSDKHERQRRGFFKSTRRWFKNKIVAPVFKIVDRVGDKFKKIGHRYLSFGKKGN